MNEIFVDVSAVVSERARLGQGCKIWGLAQVRENATLGANCSIGRGAYIGEGVLIGENCKIQNNALIYEPAVIADGVFIGPGAILTNDHFPRAVDSKGTLKARTDWKPEGVFVGQGASIGAGAICVAPLSIGEWAVVGAGSTVTRDVAPHSIVVGSPARHVGWVGVTGKPLENIAGLYVCAETGERYRELAGQLVLVEDS